MKKRAPLSLLLPLLVLCAGVARAQEQKTAVVATLPYLAEVAKEIGGDLVTVRALVPPGTDPHFLIPTPALSVAVAEADVYLENGFQLELWSERVLDGARNPNVRPGFPGHLYAGNGVTPLQVPAQQSRAFGDIHPSGNPHLWLDPLNLRIVARNVEKTLATVRPTGAKQFAENRAAFERKLDDAFYGADLVKILGVELLDRLHRSGRLATFLKEKQFQGKPLREKAGGWLARAQALEGLHFITYHQVWTYFAESFGFVVTATIEEKPGIPPSPGHLEQLEARAKADGARLVECSAFYPYSRAEEVAQRIGGVPLRLPTQPGEEQGEGAATDLFAMFDAIFSRLEAASREAGKRP